MIYILKDADAKVISGLLGNGAFIKAMLPDVQDLTNEEYKIYNNKLLADVAERENRVSTSGVVTLTSGETPSLDAPNSEIDLPGFNYFLNINKLKYAVPAQTYSLPSIGSGDRIIYYWIDSTGDLNASLSLEERQDGVYLLRIVKNDAVILSTSLVEIWQNWQATRNERIAFVNELFRIVSVVFTVVPANLQIDSGGATLEYEGASYRTNPTSPNRISFPSKTPVSFNFFRADNTIAVGSPGSTLPLSQWDSAGTLTNTTPAKGYQVALGMAQTGEYFFKYADTEWMDLNGASVRLAAFDPNWVSGINTIVKIAYRGDITDFDDTTFFTFLPTVGAQAGTAPFDIADGSVTNVKLANKAVTGDKIADSVGIFEKDINTGQIGYPAVNAADEFAIKGKTGNQISGTGEVLISNLSEIVGIGTLFLTELTIGDSIKIGTETRVVATIPGNLSLTTNLPFSGAVPAGSNLFIDFNLLAIRTGAGILKFLIDKLGNIGLGKIPTELLDVAGNIKADNMIAVNLAKLIISITSGGAIIKTIVNQTGGSVSSNWDGNEYDITLVGGSFSPTASALVTVNTFTSSGAIVGHAFRQSSTQYRVRTMIVSDTAFNPAHQAPFTLMIW